MTKSNFITNWSEVKVKVGTKQKCTEVKYDNSYNYNNRIIIYDFLVYK